jgi:hypothetical protein
MTLLEVSRPIATIKPLFYKNHHPRIFAYEKSSCQRVTAQHNAGINTLGATSISVGENSRAFHPIQASIVNMSKGDCPIEVGTLEAH